MSLEVDVAIVGGGPAGAAAAYYLASRGHSVLVCEKKAFPREKTCGDGLTPRAIAMLEDMGLGRELETWEKVNGLRVHSGGRTLDVPFPQTKRWRPYGLVRPRRDLDRAVLGNAENAGAKVLYKTEVTEPLFDGGVVTGFVAKRDGEREEVRSHFVVCGEGAATRFARHLGRTRTAEFPMGLAIRQYFTSQMHHSGWFDVYLDVRTAQGTVPGYGWAFPVGDGTVNAGVGLLSTAAGWSNANLHRLQEAFLEGAPADLEVSAETARTRPRAGRLFMGGSVWPPHGPGFVMAGDAAGMINPCSGEGISYAYETGKMAALHIDEALRSGSSASLDGYTDDLKETYGSYYRLGRNFVRFMCAPGVMDHVIPAALRSRRFMTFVLTMMTNLEDGAERDSIQKGMRFLNALGRIGL